MAKNTAEIMAEKMTESMAKNTAKIRSNTFIPIYVIFIIILPFV
jgi:hypothetical protein